MTDLLLFGALAYLLGLFSWPIAGHVIEAVVVRSMRDTPAVRPLRELESADVAKAMRGGGR